MEPTQKIGSNKIELLDQSKYESYTPYNGTLRNLRRKHPDLKVLESVTYNNTRFVAGK
jgi:hypothetical protein